jgi:hypothetical protein
MVDEASLNQEGLHLVGVLEHLLHPLPDLPLLVRHDCVSASNMKMIMLQAHAEIKHAESA